MNVNGSRTTHQLLFGSQRDIMFKFVGKLFGVFALVFLIFGNVDTKRAAERRHDPMVISKEGINVTIKLDFKDDPSFAEATRFFGRAICVPMKTRVHGFEENKFKFTLKANDGKSVKYSGSAIIYSTCTSVIDKLLFYRMQKTLSISKQVAQVTYPEKAVEIEKIKLGVTNKFTARISIVRFRQYSDDSEIYSIGPFRFLDPKNNELRDSPSLK